MLLLITWHQHPVDKLVPWEEQPREPYPNDELSPALNHAAFERQLRNDLAKESRDPRDFVILDEIEVPTDGQ